MAISSYKHKLTNMLEKRNIIDSRLKRKDHISLLSQVIEKGKKER